MRWGTARRPRAVLGVGLSAIQLHLLRDSIDLIPSSLRSLVHISPPPSASSRAPARSGCVRRHANERAVWRP